MMNRRAWWISIIFCLIILSCGGGSGGGSSVANTSPEAPQNVVPTGGNGQVSLSWGNVSGATEYHIYWSTTVGVNKQNGTKISNVSSIYYHNDLTNGTTYYYVVTAANQYGESVESQEVSATPSSANPPLPPVNVPSAPTGVSVTVGNRQAVISWTAVTGAVSYNLYWSTASNISSKNGTKVADVTSPYTHTGLNQGMVYYYVVTAVNEYGESADSATVSAVIPNDLQDVCVAMGESFTTGYGVANYADTYVPKLSAIWGKTVINKGANTTDGPQSSYGAAVIDDILAQYNPKYITIFFGCNDVGFYSADWTIGNLRYMIRSAKAHGTKPVVATLTPVFGQWAWRKPYVIALNQKIRLLASEEGINCADLEAAFGWNSAYIISDGMHPNSAGHTVIANTFYGALTR